MNSTVTPIRRRPTANAKAADPCQRTTTPRDAGHQRRASLRAVRPGRSSLSGQGTYSPCPGQYPSQRGLVVGIVVCFAAFLAGCIVLVLS
jgi:hypothetical protein